MIATGQLNPTKIVAELRAFNNRVNSPNPYKRKAIDAIIKRLCSILDVK